VIGCGQWQLVSVVCGVGSVVCSVGSGVWDVGLKGSHPTNKEATGTTVMSLRDPAAYSAKEGGAREKRGGEPAR
jgi:hypothetical protein